MLSLFVVLLPAVAPAGEPGKDEIAAEARRAHATAQRIEMETRIIVDDTAEPPFGSGSVNGRCHRDTFCHLGPGQRVDVRLRHSVSCDRSACSDAYCVDSLSATSVTVTTPGTELGAVGVCWTTGGPSPAT